MARAWAEVDLGAVRHNVTMLRDLVAPARLCVVVKADGYGHGAVPVSRAALGAGADWLGLAQVEEVVALREAHVWAPVLLLSEPHVSQVDVAIDTGAHLTVYSPRVIDAIARSPRASRGRPVPVHVKVDTGMRRVGIEPEDATATAKLVASRPELRLAGVLTHFPVADEPDNPVTAQQVTALRAVVEDIRAAGIDPGMVHAANSAGAIAHPDARLDLVRCGIATYGIPPAPALDGMVDLRPVLRLASEVSFVKRVPAGDAVSYGHRQRVERDTVVATVPIGYEDGVFRSLPLVGQDVLIRGRRRPMVGVVTMDQLMVDCGPDADVEVGEEVVLLGQQGDECITPDDWAGRLGTVSYEIVCALGPRVERRYA